MICRVSFLGFRPSEFEDFGAIEPLNNHSTTWEAESKATKESVLIEVVSRSETLLKFSLSKELLKKEGKSFDRINAIISETVLEKEHGVIRKFAKMPDFKALVESEKYLVEEMAQFYCAELVFIIETLHKSKTPIGSLRAESVFLSSGNKLLISDTGLTLSGILSLGHIEQMVKEKETQKELLKGKGVSCELEEPQSPNGVNEDSLDENIVKKMQYLAPEFLGERIKMSQERDEADALSGDWWSLGIIAFFMITGSFPFNGSNAEELKKSILTEKVPWSRYKVGYDEGCVTPEAKDFIERLLEKDPSQRLGVNDVEKAKRHGFFGGKTTALICKG